MLNDMQIYYRANLSKQVKIMNLISTVETIYGAINRIDKNLAQNIYKLIIVQMINFFK
jgi:hypothetical protein